VVVVMVMGEKFKFKIGGVEVFLSREDVEQKLQAVEPEAIREVAVAVNGRQFPVKQALAESTGLLRGNFTSHDAMRVFRKLSFPLGNGQANVSGGPSGLSIFNDTEEMTCPACNKPFTFKRLSSAQFQLEGCSCVTKQETIEIPTGALLTDFGGLWVVRVPKSSQQG
jgi:hypothetical protein